MTFAPRHTHMRYIVTAVPSLIHGTRVQRVRAAGDIVARFAVGAFITSTLLSFIDPYITANLDNNLSAVVGGVIATVIGGCIKSV